MYQSQSSNRGRQGQVADPALSHRIDILCLAIIIIGFFSCLIRSDYNLAVIFFCYFIWQQRKDALALQIIMISTILLIVIDLIFAFTEIRVWMTVDVANPVWQTIRPMHNFGVFCFVLIMLLKVALLVLTGMGVKNLKANGGGGSQSQRY